MSSVKDPKLNQLLKTWRNGTVMTAETLKEMGYSYQLLSRYKKSNWLKSPGKGAYTVAGQEVHWQGALYTLQYELNLPIRVGGLCALEMQGFGHYIKTNDKEVQLFGVEKKKLPLWFRNFSENEKLMIMTAGFLKDPDTIPTINEDYHDFSIKISAPETAYLEMLSIVPQYTTFEEALQVSENLTTLRSGILQNLLLSSSSIKVNRLALYIAEYHQHDWFNKLQTEKINLGKGKRVIQKNGKLDIKYSITVPDSKGNFF